MGRGLGDQPMFLTSFCLRSQEKDFSCKRPVIKSAQFRDVTQLSRGILFHTN